MEVTTQTESKIHIPEELQKLSQIVDCILKYSYACSTEESTTLQGLSSITPEECQFCREKIEQNKIHWFRTDGLTDDEIQKRKNRLMNDCSILPLTMKDYEALRNILSVDCILRGKY